MERRFLVRVRALAWRGLVGAGLWAAGTAAAGGVAVAAGIRYPEDAGVVNVRQAPYGARGDGRTDDTAALRRCLSERAGGGVIYFPRGVYLVSAPLVVQNRRGWCAGTVFQGESQEGTIIRLAPGARGFDDPAAPRPVIATGSQNPLDPATGAGNQAFGNSFYDLTVDAGAHPGAVGIDYLANNRGMVRDVTVRGRGVAGVRLIKAYPGPCMLDHVTVQGFGYGVDGAGGVSAVTIENLTVEGQEVAGLHNAGLVLAVRRLRSTNAVPAVVNEGAHPYGPRAEGLLALVDSVTRGAGPGAADRAAVVNRGTCLVRGLTATGYGAGVDDHGRRSAAGDPAAATDPASRLYPEAGQAGLDLPVRETPRWWEPDLRNWANVRRYRRFGDLDDTPSVQRAIDAGQPVVYFPTGEYHLSATVHVRGRVRQLLGLESRLVADAAGEFARAGQPVPMFRFEVGRPEIPFTSVEQMTLSGDAPRVFAFEDASPRPLLIRSVLTTVAGGSYRNAAGAGDLYLEDYSPSGHRDDWVRIRQQRVWARQLNSESNADPQVANDGGTLWVLGYKTEDRGTFVSTVNHGRTEVLGGFHYLLAPNGDRPAYLVRDSQVALDFATARVGDTDPGSFVREVRGREVRDLRRDQTLGRQGDATNWPRLVTLFYGGFAAGAAARTGER